MKTNLWIALLVGAQALNCGAEEKETIAYWDFNEGSGQVVKDRAGQNNGQLGLTGEPDAYDPTWVKTGEGNYALEFDNIERKNFVLIGIGKGKGEFDLKAGRCLAVSAWVKPNGIEKKAANQAYFLISRHWWCSPHSGWYVSVAPGSCLGRVSCADISIKTEPLAVNHPANLADGLWHQVVMVCRVDDYDDFIATLTLYVDGCPVSRRASNQAVPSWPLADDANLLIGLDQMVYQAYLNDPAWSTGFSGLIDEVKIYNISNNELAEEEVKQEYEKTKINYGR